MNRTFENMLAVLGVSIGINQIENILGLIILAIQLALILWRSGLAIYEKIKTKKLQDITQIIETANKDITEIYNDIKDKQKEGK